ncbi:hypothetical protein PMAC_000256 [Pneumocystis sp. 'macacae']|nr:hypothetical protein PMAC_000256 [Pneumocystis sp. 'macacae']
MKNKVGSRRGSQEVASEVGVHQAMRGCLRRKMGEGGGEVGCEKSVYRGDESVHQAVSGRRGGEVGVQIRGGG